MTLPQSLPKAAWRQLAGIYVSMVALTLASVLWADHVADEGNRHWCGVLSTFHDAYAQNPTPPNQRGQEIQTQLEQLYKDFHCASVRKP